MRKPNAAAPRAATRPAGKGEGTPRGQAPRFGSAQSVPRKRCPHQRRLVVTTIAPTFAITGKSKDGVPIGSAR